MDKLKDAARRPETAKPAPELPRVEIEFKDDTEGRWEKIFELLEDED